MFDGKTAVITGAGSGIGRSLTLKLASLGAHVWALDVNSASLEALTDEVSKFGYDVTTRTVDVASREQLVAVRDEIVDAGRGLDYWINNAGVAHLGEFLQQTPEAFDKLVAINLGGVVNGTRVALEVMETAGLGRIVNMASVAGHIPAPFMSSYVTTKHAVVGFTRALNEELSVKGSPVSLLLVSPGFVDTQIIAKGEKMGFPEWLSFLLAKPDNVANTILKAMRGRTREIYPTFNGQVLRRLYGVIPRATVRSSKVLLTKSWKDMVLNRYSR